MKTELLNQLYEILGKDHVRVMEPMHTHTTFRIGGPADYFLIPKTAEELGLLLQVLSEKEVPCFILGNGSNLLVSDDGYRGAVIQLFKNFADIRVEGKEIIARSGALLSSVAAAAKNASLTGFEFAGGIPGTIGGACVMNAGAYGGEMKQVLKEVTVMTREGEQKTLLSEELELGYRTSVIKEKEYIVLEAVLSLEEGKKEEIAEKMKELALLRTTKQPLEYPSAGSTFKRPEGYFAGKLIMDAGLRGFRIGGAQISEKHCGFVINAGGATAHDVIMLVEEVKRRVQERFGVALEPEVKFLGEIQ